ncbi:hypothetical protein AJ85_17480 [Alkalihalobacillus alcalophilus ATCC 27647 = CGMCC 1.3604]|uniref:Uncharacterized protein n=1 Tax=Alkalihalobacillus alcalophilus ATCC 27647 = CGMCC 1.3604 TaxID=1218173 RepID=A0A4S4K332_ALKAL|nr:hypothetical protein [Alkalihalobacillus alcalophilus]MED1564317.1 hypothetical protein [Alkalihalobacillus alcalophilus]THG92078.1 hypothetical protein AJ85_17480 [Alkalihalobacillus alcalophilus ATCC 27647 = CGMCC 1.3604]
MSYTIETGGSVEDKQIIEKQLFEFNLAHFPKDLRGRYKELNLYVKNEEGHVG